MEVTVETSIQGVPRGRNNEASLENAHTHTCVLRKSAPLAITLLVFYAQTELLDLKLAQIAIGVQDQDYLHIVAEDVPYRTAATVCVEILSDDLTELEVDWVAGQVALVEQRRNVTGRLGRAEHVVNRMQRRKYMKTTCGEDNVNNKMHVNVSGDEKTCQGNNLGLKFLKVMVDWTA